MSPSIKIVLFFWRPWTEVNTYKDLTRSNEEVIKIRHMWADWKQKPGATKRQVIYFNVVPLELNSCYSILSFS